MSDYKEKFVILLATGFYSGKSPVAPGTIGSLTYLLLAYFLGALILVPLFPLLAKIEIQVAFVLALLVFSIIVTKLALDAELFEDSASEKSGDPKEIVIDEFLGMATTLLFSSYSFLSLVLAFILFRAFDVLKPYPICKIEKLPGAPGVVLDDFVAGIGAGLCLWMLGVFGY